MEGSRRAVNLFGTRRRAVSLRIKMFHHRQYALPGCIPRLAFDADVNSRALAGDSESQYNIGKLYLQKRYYLKQGIRSVIDRCFKLKDGASALKYFGQGLAIGKVAITTVPDLFQ